MAAPGAVPSWRLACAMPSADHWQGGLGQYRSPPPALKMMYWRRRGEATPAQLQIEKRFDPSHTWKCVPLLRDSAVKS